MSNFNDTRFRQVARYAGYHGFVGGFPTFYQADHGQGLVYGTFLLRGDAADVHDVARDAYGVSGIDDQHLRGLISAANAYAVANGYAAAFPTCEQSAVSGPVVYGTVLIKPGITDFKDVPVGQLNNTDINNVPAMMRVAQDYAVQNGYPGGFPTFDRANHGGVEVYGIVLFKPGTITFRDISADFLARYTTPTPWAIILCHPSDEMEPFNAAKLKADFNTFFNVSGLGTGGAYDYWRDISAGSINIGGSDVFGWFDIGQTGEQIDALTGDAQRQAVYDWGCRAATGVPLAYYKHVFVFLNHPCNSGNAGAPEATGVAWGDFPELKLPALFGERGMVAHEMGHAFGLHHSFGENRGPCALYGQPGEYCDWYDIMSWSNVGGFVQFPARTAAESDVHAGPGMNALKLSQLGAIDFTRDWSPPAPPFDVTVTLAALNRPDIDSPLVARFVAAARDPRNGISIYTLEYREPTAWDRGIGPPVVLIHEMPMGGPHLGRSILLTNFNGGMLPLGREFQSADRTVAISLEKIDVGSHTASVRFRSISGVGRPAVVIKDVINPPPGTDPLNEIVILENASSSSIDLTGWTLIDSSVHTYSFPPVTVPTGMVFTVRTGHGTDTSTDFFWGQDSPVWNNTGDTATLLDSFGNQISLFSYP